MQFAFRWMNCLLMREISVQNTIRMWDTYLVCAHSVLNLLPFGFAFHMPALSRRHTDAARHSSASPFSRAICAYDAVSLPLQAEGPDAFSQFHLYVCSAFLVQWSRKLREMDFQVRARFLSPLGAEAHLPPR